MPPELRALMRRYSQLGCLLPPLDDIDARVDEAKLILDEMAVVQLAIDRLLARHRSEVS